MFFQKIIHISIQEFLSKKISYIIPENGWSEYWEINDFGVYFGGRLILKNEIDGENTSTLIKAQYAYAGGAYEKTEGFTINLSALLNETQPSAVLLNGQPVQMPENGVLTLSFKDYTFGESNEIVITVNGKNLIQSFVCVRGTRRRKKEFDCSFIFRLRCIAWRGRSCQNGRIRNGRGGESGSGRQLPNGRRRGNPYQEQRPVWYPLERNCYGKLLQLRNVAWRSAMGYGSGQRSDRRKGRVRNASGYSLGKAKIAYLIIGEEKIAYDDIYDIRVE